jgi:hypothetical protein
VRAQRNSKKVQWLHQGVNHITMKGRGLRGGDGLEGGHQTNFGTKDFGECGKVLVRWHQDGTRLRLKVRVARSLNQTDSRPHGYEEISVRFQSFLFDIIINYFMAVDVQQDGVV